MTAMQRPFLGDLHGAMVPGVRRRLVIDPIWRVIDAQQYRSLWKVLSAEAAFCGFVGFDMEWTTTLQAPDVDSDNIRPPKARGASGKPKARRLLGPVATIQLSTYSCTIVVKWIHLHALATGGFADVLRDPFAPTSASWPCYRQGQSQNSVTLLHEVYTNMLHLIHDQRIFKTGVGIHGDEVKLHRDYPPVQLRSAVDLVELADACLPDTVPDHSRKHTDQKVTLVRTDSLRSLSNMCCALTGRRLGKDMAVVMSNWGGCHGALTPLQIEYAAEDAEASYDVCVAILKGGGFIVDNEASATHSSNSTTHFPWSMAKELDCREVLACCTTAPISTFKITSAALKGAANGAAGILCDAPETDVDASVSKAPCSTAADIEEEGGARWCRGRERPYYDNINVFDPDMQLVFTVDKSKANWYVKKKGLARVVQWRTPAGAIVTEEEKGAFSDAEHLKVSAIQLSFAPDLARYNDVHIRRNMDYFKQQKDNICVVCGSGGSLVRFAVVPLMYRRFFPRVYMSHNSYDLLLLCPPCFAKSRLLYDRLRQNVADDFGIPLTHLRAKQRDEYADVIRQMAQAIDVRSTTYEEAKRRALSTPGHVDVPERDCDLHPRLRLRGMQDFLALMEHRETLDKVFSFAKALHLYYESLRRHAEASDSGDGDIDVGNVVASPDGACRPSEMLTRLRRRNRHHSQKVGTACAAGAALLPAERRTMMADYLRKHASVYPFFARRRDEVDCQDGRQLQDAVFHAESDGAASAQGVRFILTGVAEVPGAAGYMYRDSAGMQQGNSSRSVLTRYWLDTHSELLTMLPTLTRAEERPLQPVDRGEVRKLDSGLTQRNSPSADIAADSEAWGMPYVDSHAFLVVRLLLEKYSDSSLYAKTGDHAVGQFIFRWRSSFVEGMHPQHLPCGWTPEDGILQ
ncbi:conserved hypothetical protein [Leishmania braziliensis MHOM/BR/75/M2904]|uniref:3'-5' exonuclease domain-containing protein n=2 Tax=Leishmania braziliensis TaxID=5660 RepID=A4HJQ7_LEIBR|nr:conserved hypothetical protein [Leishmania braziliensis MHOM/BR/75/M2904]CAJ2478089.1 unnamed protein product [Leishmania braziliensis]CAJ2478538.1 unnamed protein product [Leishmania braziliensis]CAM42724.2 conserved hypothetical protein [Leishmania braziliensis MHOM/BR/75/M2904]SYZ68451.1 hypothetical_protein [Leishmania braziliensis MHOM/BR/75/M2904]